jgi:predicted  nucleic acid-binding Zn-ribbon protein
MDQYHLGEVAGQALSELEKLEAEVAQLASDNSTLRRERDDARYQIAVMSRCLDAYQKTISAYVEAEKKRNSRDPWGYREK